MKCSRILEHAIKRDIARKTKNVTGKCPHCGKHAKIGEKFCSYRKHDRNMAKLKDRDKTSSKQKECPKCKSLNAPDSVICASCGINYVEYEMSQPPDLSGMSALRKRKKE